MVFERERLQICVEIGAQFEERLQADFYEQVIRDPINDSPRELDYDEGETEQGNQCAPIAACSGRGSQKIVHDDFERPWLEQI